MAYMKLLFLFAFSICMAKSDEELLLPPEPTKLNNIKASPVPEEISYSTELPAGKNHANWKPYRPDYTTVIDDIPEINNSTIDDNKPIINNQTDHTDYPDEVTTDDRPYITPNNSNDEKPSTALCSIMQHPSEVHIGNGFFIQKESNNSYILLTSAGSTYGQNVNELYVTCFTDILNSGAVTFKVLKVIYHPEYNPTYGLNDIAIMMIEKPEQKIIDTNAVIFRLPEPYEIKPGMTAYYFRWVINETDNRLHQTVGKSKIISNAKATLVLRKFVRGNKVCIDNVKPSLGRFNEGAVLAFQAVNKTYSAQGIYNDQFNIVNKLTCYEQIAPYVNWITKVLMLR